MHCTTKKYKTRNEMQCNAMKKIGSGWAGFGWVKIFQFTLGRIRLGRLCEKYYIFRGIILNWQKISSVA